MTVAGRSLPELWVCHLGSIPYRDALALQERVRHQRQAGELPDTLLTLEHPPVYTRGRRSGPDDLPFGEDVARSRGVDVVATDRGGKLTYHGPGQLVGYPIMAIHDVHRFLRTMEDAIIAALSDEGIDARSRRAEGIDYTGVWVGERKIASIGVHVSRGVSTHGFAVNVDNDLAPFSHIIACGLPSVEMTSIARESSRPTASLACFRKRMAHSFCQAHERRQRLVTPQRLCIPARNAHGLATERAPIKSVAHPRLDRRRREQALPA
jgi:lipoate-protein ligase B